MCLYPKYGVNPKYRPNKKNGGHPPKCTDKRLYYIPFKCGKCYECRKQKQREWRVRLSEELRSTFGYFVTLTFENSQLERLEKQTGLKWEKNPNEVAKQGIRYFLERVRKDTGKSMKHWFVTELGEDKDRIHLHGITFGQTSAYYLKKHWNYGNVFIGTFCNEKSVNYMTKYMLKVDIKHKDFTQIVLCSKGIGEKYIDREKKGWQKRNYKKICVPTYTFRNGVEMAMPKYFKDKIFTEKERETMWINNLERGIEWIGGEKVDADDELTIANLRRWYQRVGQKTFNDDPIAWEFQKQERKRQKQRAWVRKHLRGSRKRRDFEPLQGVSPGQKYEKYLYDT